MENDHTRNLIATTSEKLYSTEKMVSDYYHLYGELSADKRILEIDVNYRNSSTGQIVYDLYSAAEKYGKEAAVCYGRGPAYQNKNVYKFGMDWETYLHAGLSRITGYNACFSIFSTKRLIAYIEKFKPGIIHIHELHAYFVNIKPLISYIKQKEIPLVWTFHCEYMYTGKCGHAYECKKFQKECGDCPAVKDYPKSIFFDRTKEMFNQKKKLLRDLKFTIVTPSKWMEDRVKSSFLRDKPIRTIFNGVDISVFYPREITNLRMNLGINENEKVAIFVAPDLNDERKGGQWVIKLAEETLKRNIVFLMVGGGKIPNTYPNNMKYLGMVQDKDILASYYTLADAFILCSQRETYSMTCAEALCCGTPIVGFESGAPETVFEGKHANFVPYGNIEQLKQTLLEVLYKGGITE